MSIEIRDATSKDIEAIKKIVLSTINNHHKSLCKETYINLNIKKDEFCEYILKTFDRCDIITKNFSPIGIACYKNNQLNIMIDTHLLHKKEFGEALLKHSEKKLFNEHSKIFLEVFGPDKKTKNFYQEKGWQEIKNSFENRWNINRIIFSKSEQTSISMILDSLEHPPENMLS